MDPEAQDALPQPARRQWMRAAPAMFAVAGVTALFAGWNTYRDLTHERRRARLRRRKWKFWALTLLWLGLGAYQLRRQRNSSI